jgi:hypothetical protein
LVVPVTVAVYCTVLGVDDVLAGMEAGDAGEDVTVITSCKECTFRIACPVVTLSWFDVAVTTIPHGLTGTVCGAV